jgi:flagellar motor switch protein FliM
MTATLTQKAIDALVRGASQGAPQDPPTEAQPYDFVRPLRIPRERRVALEAVLARFTQALETQLAPRLREPLDVTLGGLDQVTFSEFAQSLRTPCAAFVFPLGQGPGRGVLDLGNPVAFHLVDRLFGGTGEADVPTRPLTGLEQAAVRGVVESVLALLGDAWQGGLGIATRPLGFESNPTALAAMEPGADVLVVDLAVRAGPLAGQITLGLPLAALDSFSPERDASRLEPQATAERAAPCRAAIAELLQQARLDFVVRLPVFRLTARALSSLAPGQVLQSGCPAASAVEVHVNGRLSWLGALGQAQGYVGVRITQPVAAPALERSPRCREGRIQ